GILSMAWIILGYFGIFDLGLGRAATRFAAEALGSGRADRVPEIAWTAVLIQAALGVVGGLALIALAPLIASRILNIPSGLLNESRLSLYLLGLAVPAVLISGSLRGVLEAAQRFDLVNAITAPFSAGNYLLPLVVVWLYWRFPGIVDLLLSFRCRCIPVL